MAAQAQFPSLELLQGAVERSLDSQERRITSLEQRAGVLLGFSGVLVGVIAREGKDLSWWAVLSALLALAAAVCSAVVIAPRGSDAVRPRRLLEHYAASDPENTRFRLLSTQVVIYDAEEAVARTKGRLLRAAVVLLPTSVLVLLVGVTVDSPLAMDVGRLLRRLQ